MVEVQVGEDQVRDLVGPDADGTEQRRQPALGDSDLSEIVRQSAELLLGYALRPQGADDRIVVIVGGDLRWAVPVRERRTQSRVHQDEAVARPHEESADRALDQPPGSEHAVLLLPEERPFAGQGLGRLQAPDDVAVENRQNLDLPDPHLDLLAPSVPPH